VSPQKAAGSATVPPDRNEVVDDVVELRIAEVVARERRIAPTPARTCSRIRNFGSGLSLIAGPSAPSPSPWHLRQYRPYVTRPCCSAGSAATNGPTSGSARRGELQALAMISAPAIAAARAPVASRG
jgi:hypothetical protein